MEKIKDKDEKEKIRRISLLDELRGFAILAMIVHHSFLDIGDVLSLGWGYKIFDELCTLQPIFWAIFIIISGICSMLSRSTIKRGAIVFGAGLVVTFATAVVMPYVLHLDGAQIYFGILSCLGCCMIITGLLQPLIEKTPSAVGLVVTAGLFVATYNVSSGTLLFGLVRLPDFLYSTNYLAPLGFYSETFRSADYFALLPWLFMFLFGAFIGKFAKAGAFPEWTYKKRSRLLSFVGKNSLWFYLGHQVVIYAILYAVAGIIYIAVK